MFAGNGQFKDIIFKTTGIAHTVASFVEGGGSVGQTISFSIHTGGSFAGKTAEFCIIVQECDATGAATCTFARYNLQAIADIRLLFQDVEYACTVHPADGYPGIVDDNMFPGVALNLTGSNNKGTVYADE